MEQELFLPTLMHWQYGNNWCGSLKRASFWITPKDEQLTAQLWTGPAIRENAEILYTAQFPISDEGLEQLRTWLLEHAAAVNAAAHSDQAFTCCSEHNAHNPGTGCGHKECHFYRNNP